MSIAVCVPVIELDGWEEAQAPVYVKEPERIRGKIIFCVKCGQVLGWVHVYMKKANQEPKRLGYFSHAVVCLGCEGDPSLRELHHWFYVSGTILTGPKAVRREIELAAKAKGREFA